MIHPMKEYLFLANIVEFFSFLEDYGKEEYDTKNWSISGYTVSFGDAGAISIASAIEEYFSAKKEGWGS